MYYADFSKGYVLKMDRGEKFHETILKFFGQKRFASAFYQGIGALYNVELKVFNHKKNDYISHTLQGKYKLITAMGNISLFEGRPFPHTHVCLGDKNCQTLSGHLLEATVSVTEEIFLIPIDIALIRKPDKALNFNGLELPHHFVEH